MRAQVFKDNKFFDHIAMGYTTWVSEMAEIHLREDFDDVKKGSEICFKEHKLEKILSDKIRLH